MFFTMIRVAVLVDGGFYRHAVVRYSGEESATDAATRLYKYCLKHVTHDQHEETRLYRILYYDCAPSGKNVYHPLKKATVNLAKGSLYQWTMQFLEELKKKRKLALRLGRLADEFATYNLKSEVTKELCSGKRNVKDLTEADFCISIKQKGVDTRIGIDIVAMSLKNQVDKIVLIAGDSDFIPAVKFARREGIDFILDPLGTPIKPELSEHIDGLSFFPDLLRCPCHP